MKFRQERTEITDAEERALEESVRSLERTLGETPVPPAEAYWSNVIVKANRKIDESTSGKALSINWALRVAIPGVVAVLSFVIGLHYYVPEKPHQNDTINAVLQSLPNQVVDSLLTGNAPADLSVSPSDIGGDIFTFSESQIADYLIDRGAAETLVDGLSDQQVGDVVLAISMIARTVP